MKQTINEQFTDLIREQMTDEEFWEWVRGWLDVENIIEMAEMWDEEEKKATLKEWSAKTKKGFCWAQVGDEHCNKRIYKGNYCEDHYNEFRE